MIAATGGFRLTPPERRRFAEPAREHQVPVEDSVELVEKLVEQGPGPLAQLDRQGRMTALQLAIEAFPPGPGKAAVSEMAWISLVEVDRVRTDQESSNNTSFSLNGVSYTISYSPPAKPPGLVQSYRDFLELRELAGSSTNPGIEARNALDLELRHFHGDLEDCSHFRTFLGLTGSSSLAAWGVHRLREEDGGQEAVERLSRLRPGLENEEFYHFVPLACRADDAVWEKVAAAEEYTPALRRLGAVQRLGGQLDPWWGQLEAFEDRLKEQGVSEKQITVLVDWAAENMPRLREALPGREDVFSALSEALDKRRHTPAHLEEVLAEQRPGESWGETASRVAEIHWLHGGLEAQKEHLSQVEQAWRAGSLPQPSLQQAREDFDARLRLERVLGTAPAEAARTALAALRHEPGSLYQVELTPETLTVGSISIPVEDY